MANVAQILCDVIPPRVYTKQTHAVLMFVSLRRCSTMQTDRQTDGPPDRYTETSSKRLNKNTHHRIIDIARIVCVYVCLNVYWTCSCFV